MPGKLESRGAPPLFLESSLGMNSHGASGRSCSSSCGLRHCLSHSAGLCFVDQSDRDTIMGSHVSMILSGYTRVCIINYRLYMHFANARGKFKIYFTRCLGEGKSDED